MPFIQHLFRFLFLEFLWVWEIILSILKDPNGLIQMSPSIKAKTKWGLSFVIANSNEVNCNKATALDNGIESICLPTANVCVSSQFFFVKYFLNTCSSWTLINLQLVALLTMCQQSNAFILRRISNHQNKLFCGCDLFFCVAKCC